MKPIIHLLALLQLFSCCSCEQKINPETIKGKWYLNKWTTFLSLKVSDSSIFVDNHVDTVFNVKYSISHDTLITYAPFTNKQFKNKIILLTKDTLVLDGIMDVEEARHYSRVRTFQKEVSTSRVNDSRSSVDPSSNKPAMAMADSLLKIEFWNAVIIPILNHDKAKVLSNMEFPVNGHWTQMMELDKRPSEATREDFARVYDHFFNKTSWTS